MLASRSSFDLGIIGGGIIGLATARQVALRHPKLKICVFEKESELASHQSKRNSGVVHQGIYYKKGTLKSRFCIKGAKQALEYCKTKNLPYNQCGKLIVATKPNQLETLHNLLDNAKQNGVEDLELLPRDKICKIQPGCDSAIEAIWSPKTAIVDWNQVALSYANDFKQLGGTILTDFLALKLKPCDNFNLRVHGRGDPTNFVECKSVINCAGLYNDTFVAQTGNTTHPSVVPFKGWYFQLSDALALTVKTNIYPVPDPSLPFLGVHITPRLDGSVIVGPTANLSLNYDRYDLGSTQMNLFQAYHIVFKTGLRNLLRKKQFRQAAVHEFWRLISKRKFASEVRDFLPALKENDLIDNNFCGVRAQMVTFDGNLVDDFLFETGLLYEYNRVLHIRNCPSPAATSALPISERIANILEERLI